MNNRQNIRWLPFESLFSTKEVIEELEQKKSLHTKPILSEDELELLEKQILEAYHTKSLVKISFYSQGKEKSKIGFITAILKQQLQIYFSDHTSLYFEQILKLEFLEY